ncbi:hypothetical protein ACA910_002918 [Epithemia clementina (nom. ined.)]
MSSQHCFCHSLSLLVVVLLLTNVSSFTSSPLFVFPAQRQQQGQFLRTTTRTTTCTQSFFLWKIPRPSSSSPQSISVVVLASSKKEDAIVTPSFPQENPYNFGPASSRGTTLYTCGRPGGGNPPDKDATFPTKIVVDEWAKFMTSPDRQIRHAVILLSDKELQAYEDPGLLAAYEAAGITAYHIPLAADNNNSYQTIMATLDQIDAKGERAVTHCTGGVARCGRVAAGWIVHKYGITPEEATEETLEAARANKVERMGSPQLLKAWIGEME